MNECLKQFLIYGRQLTVDEQEFCSKTNENNSSFAKESSPKLEDFKYQVPTKFFLNNNPLFLLKFSKIFRYVY